MSFSVQGLKSMLRTAQRAGWRRTLYRLERVVRLRCVNPYLAAYLYPMRQLHTSPKFASAIQLDVLRQIAQFHAVNHIDEWQQRAVSTLSLLNQAPVPLMPPVAWSESPIVDPLWLFHLHGWEWAWPAGAEEHNSDLLFALSHDWISQQKIGVGMAWEPYPTARRLVVWATLWHLLQGDDAMAAAIRQQAHYLSNHLERDLDNNHLIANAKALSWVGLLFPAWTQSEQWRTQGLTILWHALAQQVGHDGAHKENSSGYHLAVWQDGLETALLCKASNVPVPSAVWSLLRRMGEFVRDLQRPDGRLPMLNDSLEDEPIAAQLLLKFAAALLDWPTLLECPRVAPGGDAMFHTFSECRYVVFRNEGIFLLFDAGDLGMAHCPGHGHADALSFELWHSQQPLIVDPGVYQYPAGPWRSYFRSTAAHSTATVDQLDQSEFVGPFRVGTTAHAELISATLSDSSLAILARHDGYTRLADPVRHQRAFQWHGNEGLIVDEFSGKAAHTVTLHLHLAPCKAEIVNEHTITAAYPDGTRVTVEFVSVSPGKLTLENGWMSRTWYQKEATPVISYQLQGSLPIMIRTKLRINQ